jgi:hypothetical protein
VVVNPHDFEKIPAQPARPVRALPRAPVKSLQNNDLGGLDGLDGFSLQIAQIRRGPVQPARLVAAA